MQYLRARGAAGQPERCITLRHIARVLHRLTHPVVRQVIKGGRLDIDFVVLDPSGNRLFEEKRREVRRKRNEGGRRKEKNTSLF